MRTFRTIWLGQFASLLGTGMTRFALLIWAYEQTGQATTLALLGFFSLMPYLILSPLAGVWADRFDRRRLMILADTGAGLSTALLLALLLSGHLAIWHIYLLASLASIFETFQLPAYTASISLLLPKDRYDRASGMRSMADNASQIVAPLAAGALLPFVGLAGVMALDLVTFLIALATLFAVQIPAPAKELASRGQIWGQLTFGFRFIFARPGLRWLLYLYTGINFFAAVTYFSVLPALVLARTGGDELALGAVQAALGGAGVVGGLLVSLWGLPRRKIHAILAGAALSFLGGDILFAVGRSLPAWILGACIASVFIPGVMAANAAIWQRKVPPAQQGRVLSTYGMLRNLSSPLGYLVAGPLADWFFEPAMQSGGALADSFGWLVGTGPGAGIGLMFACTAFLGCAMSLSGYLIPAVRNIETDLPDFDEPLVSRKVAAPGE